MQSRTAKRAAALTAVALVALVVGAPSVLAETARPADTAQGASAEHRQNHEGSLDEPQPASNADFTGSGANEHGAYDSTRDGSPSENGNGDGAATGEPCAGCVGSADNKNPPGQAPDGTDANNGYECDGNAGIGQSNPAHTGCEATSTPEVPLVPLVPLVPVVETHLTPKTPAAPTGEVEALAVVATPETPARDTAVLGISLTAPAPTGAVLGTELTRAIAPAALATTGAGSLLLPLTLAGIVLALIGSLILFETKRSATS